MPSNKLGFRSICSVGEKAELPQNHSVLKTANNARARRTRCAPASRERAGVSRADAARHVNDVRAGTLIDQPRSSAVTMPTSAPPGRDDVPPLWALARRMFGRSGQSPQGQAGSLIPRAAEAARAKRRAHKGLKRQALRSAAASVARRAAQCLS